ncbi:tetraacyldisaccharide 4'-kinase [Salinisphaera aquimarina]|uniref:Tetraacyldisaccharide 4'-kinase n=1 Tax=Salinisphaera aquimarina TaxID=2094031 RepID=A0ABV7ERB0_9GAMM
MAGALERSWYRRDGAWPLLKPLAWLFGRVVALRRLAYAQGWLKSRRVPVPVLVVGNITVGGSGKTPLTLALVARLVARGRRVGVVSRGYGGKAARYPLQVAPDTPSAQSGDEPLLIACRSAARVVVDPDRPRAAITLVEQSQVDMVIADDGLQHYALARDAEIAVTDSRRGLGNGWLLPAGPLREPPERLDGVDLSLIHGAGEDFWLAPVGAVSLVDDRTRPLADFRDATVHAVAGIGDPGRFFSMLREHAIEVIEHAQPDHHVYRAADIVFDDGLPVLMTEKDAVKCRDFADARHWSVPVELVFSPACEARVDALLDRLCALPLTKRKHLS